MKIRGRRDNIRDARMNIRESFFNPRESFFRSKSCQMNMRDRRNEARESY